MLRKLPRGWEFYFVSGFQEGEERTKQRRSETDIHGSSTFWGVGVAKFIACAFEPGVAQASAFLD